MDALKEDKAYHTQVLILPFFLFSGIHLCSEDATLHVQKYQCATFLTPYINYPNFYNSHKVIYLLNTKTAPYTKNTSYITKIAP